MHLPQIKLYSTSLSSFALVLALGACGDDSGDNGDDQGRDSGTNTSDAGRDSGTQSGLDGSTTVRDASSDSSVSTDRDAAADTGVMDASASDAGSDAGTTTTIPTLNGCAPADYVDLSTMATPTVTFTNFAYTPKCATISAGQSVVFSGSFQAHPLAKGTVTGATTDPTAGSANSPISNGTGNSKTIAFPTAGTYPYYCTAHTAQGMVGSIHVK